MKKIQKILLVLGLAFVFAGTISVSQVSAADCDNIFTSDYWDNAEECLMGGEEGSTSFTDFRGGLTAPIKGVGKAYSR